MKKTILLAALCYASLVNSQNGAVIEYKLTSSKGPKGTLKISYSEFGSLSEFNMIIPQMPGGGIVSKNLSQKSKPDSTYTINDKSKTYSAYRKTEGGEDNKVYTVSKMPDEKLNGYNCTHVVMTDGIESYEIWNTMDIKEFEKYSEAFKLNKKSGSQKREEALRRVNANGFPVKTIHKGNEKEGDMTMELVKIEKKSFTKADFEIPADYVRSGTSAASPAGPQMKSQQEIMNMSPEERAKYIEEMKKKYGK